MRQLVRMLGFGVAFLFGVLEAAPTPPATKIPSVFVQKVKAVELHDLLSFPARLIPKVNATVLADTDGMVVRIVAPLGREVSRNQNLLVIKNTDPLYDYRAVNVPSPVKGVVSAVEVTEGSRITKGQKLITITDPNRVTIGLEIAVADMSAIHAGMRGQLFVPGFDDPFPVRVRGISPFVDPGTGTATAELEMVKDGKSKLPQLPPGVVGTVTFRAREHKGFQLPENAIVYRGESTLVRIVEDKKAKYQPIVLGQMRRGMVEVVKGLTEGMEVIIRSSTYVADGDTVTTEELPSGQSLGE